MCPELVEELPEAHRTELRVAAAPVEVRLGQRADQLNVGGSARGELLGELTRLGRIGDGRALPSGS
jgi:hypothetical protein